MNDVRRLGVAMRAWRKAHKVKQADAAASAHLDITTWCQIETGRHPDRHPTPNTVRAIARTIGMPLVEALHLAGHKPAATDVAADFAHDLDEIVEDVRGLTDVVRALRTTFADRVPVATEAVSDFVPRTP